MDVSIALCHAGPKFDGDSNFLIYTPTKIVYIQIFSHQLHSVLYELSINVALIYEFMWNPFKYEYSI